MNNTDIQKKIDNIDISMQMDRFIMSDEEKEAIRKVLNGDISFADQLKIYIDNTKKIGKLFNFKKWKEFGIID